VAPHISVLVDRAEYSPRRRVADAGSSAGQRTENATL